MVMREDINNLDFSEIIALINSLEREEREWIPLKIAFLRNITIDPIIPYLKFLCFKEGFKADVYMADYNNVMQEVLNPDSQLYKHQPYVVVLALRLHNMSEKLVNCFSALKEQEIQDELDRIVKYVDRVIEAIRKRSQALILLHSFEVPVYPSFGILDSQRLTGQVHCIKRLNLALIDVLSKYKNSYLIDMELMMGRIGYHRFVDNRYWHIGKAPYILEAMKVIALEYIKFICALKGKNKKCLVLDCDNTLWGGIIGEDGLNGIKIGKTYPGSAYRVFQLAILNLYHRGVILAICSKNNEGDVMEVLKHHPDMVLREEHFASMMINWGDKVSNLKEMARELNIGLDSFVFVDDSEFEANLVKKYLPEVEVILLPKDPTQFKTVLDCCGLFDTLTFSEEDRRRGQMYKAEAGRKKLQAELTNLEDYYKSLEMEVLISKADDYSIPRIAQLTQRTNQFNLTTKRYSESEIRRFAVSACHDVLFLRLRDRFGDMGIVGVAFLEHLNGHSLIDTFLLSCRAIGRGVEDILLRVCIEITRERGQKTLQGFYIKTKKNGQVTEFYQKRGFNIVEQTDSETKCVFAVNQPFPKFSSYFKSVEIGL